MAALSVGGVSVKVQRARRVRRALAVAERMFDDSVVTTRPGSASSLREWEVEAGIYTAAEATTLLSTLEAPGNLTATGDIIGGSLSARASAIRVERGTIESHVFVTFTLTEAP